MPYRRIAKRMRNLGTVATALVHAYLAIIGVFDRLSYTVPTKYELLQDVASDGSWIPLHGIMAVLLIAGFWRVKWESQLASASSALMGAWAVFNLLWGISAVQPVSLAAPGLALFVSVGAHVLAASWAWEWDVPSESR